MGLASQKASKGASKTDTVHLICDATCDVFVIQHVMFTFDDESKSGSKPDTVHLKHNM